MSKDDESLNEIAKEINMTDVQTDNLSAAQAKDMEATLAALDEVSPPEEEVVEETIEEIEDLDLAEEAIEEPEDDGALEELDIEDLEAVERAANKAEIYEGQTSTTSVGTTDTGELAKKAAKGAKRASTPRTPRDMNAVPAEHFVLNGDASAMKPDEIEQAKKDVMAAVPEQKKVAEKFENVFQSMAVGRPPSKYVMTAFAALDKSGALTSAELVAAFKTSGVGEGTARSQSGQIMALFPALGIAKRDGKSLNLKPDSNIATYLRKQAGA